MDFTKHLQQTKTTLLHVHQNYELIALWDECVLSAILNKDTANCD